MSRKGREAGEIVEGKGGIDEEETKQEHVKLHFEGEAKYLRSDALDEEEKGERRVEDPGKQGVQVISATCQSNPADRQGGKEKEALLANNNMIHRNKSDEEEQLPNDRYFYQLEQRGEGSLQDACLTLTLVLFNLIWSVGLTYWNFQLDNFEVAVTSLVIIILSGAITTLVFFTTKSSPSCTARKMLWDCSKVAWLLAAIPCLVPVTLAIAYFISTMLNRNKEKSADNLDKKETKGPSATSPTLWKAGAGCFFLIESLTLCFPMCVLHGCVLMEDKESIPSVVGCFTLLGLFFFSLSITFSRFQFDSIVKADRFGEGTEMYLRLFYLWSAKIIWLVTFAILIVTTRLVKPEWKIEGIVLSVVVLTAIHEIPLWICLLPQCGRLAGKVSGLFFLIPQFTSLISLVYWVNTDSTVYHTNIGSIILGLYFWAEAVTLLGWLADGNADKDTDLLPLYPHFFGDLISLWFSHETESDSNTVLLP